MKSQDYAMEIENVLKSFFKCNKHGFGYITNSNFIIYNPFCSIICGLSAKYQVANENLRSQIELYIKKYVFFSKMDINEIIEFSDYNQEGDLIDNIISELKQILEI